MSKHMPSKHRSKHISDNMSTHMSECVSEHVSEHMSCRPIKHLGVCASAVVHSEKVVPGLQCKPVAESVRACVRACVRTCVRAHLLKLKIILHGGSGQSGRMSHSHLALLPYRPGPSENVPCKARRRLTPTHVRRHVFRQHRRAVRHVFRHVP